MSAVVLMYHRVAAPERDPYGLAVTPERFAEQMQLLHDRGDVVPLQEVLDGGAATRVAITFDDGYADNATTAAPLVAQAGLPVTWFITTGTLGGRRFWWDRLATAMLAEDTPDGVDVTAAGRGLWLSLDDPAARLTSLAFLHRRLRPLPPDELADVVEDVLSRLPPSPAPVDALTMTVEQLRELAAAPLAEIGAHTRTHLQLAGQREELQRSEIAGSVEDLRVLLDREITAFAFPFGSPSAVGALAPRLARAAGCRLACSTEAGSVTSRSDRYRLPRLNVSDWTDEELAERIRRVADHG